MTDEKDTRRTTYVILKRHGASDAEGAEGKDSYVIAMRDLEASSAEGAIRTFAAGKEHRADHVIEGAYIAVPSRSFVEKTVKIETKKQVTLG